MAASCLHLAAFILSCFLLLNSVTDAIYSMDQTCTLFSEGYIADPSSCANWGYCRGGKVIAKGACSNNLLYNSYTGGCDYPDNVNCALNKTTMCNGQNAVYKPDPDNCGSYCYCENSKNSGCATCPPQQVFNPNTNSCVYGSKYNCPVDSPCLLVQNNQFVADPDPANCGNYLRCVSGASAGPTKACSTPGYVFNPANGKCDTTTSMNCTGQNTPNAQGPNQAEIYTICGQYTGTTPDPQYFPDGYTCGGYVACTALNEGSWQMCEFATHFDATLKECVSPISYQCTLDRCSNLNLNFVTAANTQCGSYFVCANQAKAGTVAQKCSDANDLYPYYDEIAGGCVMKKPSYTICQ